MCLIKPSTLHGRSLKTLKFRSENFQSAKTRLNPDAQVLGLIKPENGICNFQNCKFAHMQGLEPLGLIKVAHCSQISTLTGGLLYAYSASLVTRNEAISSMGSLLNLLRDMLPGAKVLGLTTSVCVTFYDHFVDSVALNNAATTSYPVDRPFNIQIFDVGH
ncbi:hypothetical protein K435DRAFT_789648 [Dendrothele bispora CBS 962.96]|uniref:Uncharacterized protein n=1 Tax=Dendrothele bispora (strain CBS 962.96) TaxID=1314807 RepID=A0A4S8MUZ2_DENBC|nr:hypothetical protein K435DRAFT_789648 [Dendrothele bispora CBS 962.96]